MGMTEPTALPARRAYVNLQQCPSCLGSYPRLRQHNCPLEPVTHERLTAFVHKMSVDGRLMPTSRYRLNVKGTGLPSLANLREAIGEWSEVAAHFGLQPHLPHPDMQCGHCGHEFTKRNLKAHRPRCPKNPEVHARFLAFIAAIAPDGVFPSAHAYVGKVSELSADVPPVSAIVGAFGTWLNAKPEWMTQAGEGRIYDKAIIWEALGKWFLTASQPYQATNWNEFVAGTPLPNLKQISYHFHVNWNDIVLEITGEKPYPIRDEEDMAQNYRSLVTVRTSDIDRADRLCEGMPEGVERMRVFLGALGYPAHHIERFAAA
jgi:hypothetical protein